MSLRRPIIALPSLWIAYALVLRRRILTWGATAAEVGAHLPGDELLPDPDRTATRAISIAAPPAAVWPWIVQIGPRPRGGAYTYDWIENLLGLDMHSADRVLADFQHPRLGERIGLGPNEMIVAVLEPERAFGWLSADGSWLWTFTLEPAGGGTRLISRNSYRLPTLAVRIGMLPLELGSLVMERRMLAGIRDRAERLAREPS